MVNTNLVWENIREQIESKRSPEATSVIRKYILQLPSVLHDLIDLPITIQSIRQAQLRIDEYLLASNLPKELAEAEFQHPSKLPSYGKPTIAGNEEDIKKQLRRWIILSKDNLDNVEELIVDERFDSERRLPHWTREQQVLYHVITSIDFVELYYTRTLTFKDLLEMYVTELWPYLPLGR